jgi:pyruvate/2-oxoglutarate dehydrogenase complex dihydrolipoamide dehydrogenase (E3) component
MKNINLQSLVRGPEAARRRSLQKGFKLVVIEKGALGGTRLISWVLPFALSTPSARPPWRVFQRQKVGIDADLFTESLEQWMKAQRAQHSTGPRTAERFGKARCQVAFGLGTLVDEHRIRITTEYEKHEEIEVDSIILATGARPDYIGSQNSRIINSDQLLDRIHPPAHLFIIGGGYVGCEFAAIYRGFGCQVTLAEQSDRLLPDWDENVGAHIAQQLAADGVELMLANIP